MSKPPEQPYPPDLEEGAEPVAELGERLVDCVAEDADWANLRPRRLEDVLFEDCVLREAELSTARLSRVELRRCDLAGLRGAESLRGARMPWNDVLQNAPLFAAALGIELAD